MSTLSSPLRTTSYAKDTCDDDLGCESTCYWDQLMNEDMRKTLQEANYNAGWATFFLGMWLNSAILMSPKLRSEKSYRNLLSYTIATTVRRAMPVAMMIKPVGCIIECYGNTRLACKMIGFVDTFTAVFELECLTQVCIERLIYALYMYKGWTNPDWHNKLFLLISVGLAFIYASMPVLGFGNYGRDFDCVNCTFDVLLPKVEVYKYITILVMVLKNIKPPVTMTFSLNFTRWMEVNKIKKDNQDNIVFTMSVCIIVLVNMVFWFPIFMVRASVVVSQLLFKKTTLIWSPCFVMWAISMHWISSIVAMIGFIWYNPRVRAKMMNLVCYRPIDADEPAQSTQPAQDQAQETAK